MRALAMVAALALVTAPVLAVPSFAYADGIERPRQPRQSRPRPAPQPVAPPPVIERGPETVTLSDSFFAGSAGGVGADVGVGQYYSSTVVIRGSGASASAFAHASARASARGGFRGGHKGGGCGCR